MGANGIQNQGQSGLRVSVNSLERTAVKNDFGTRVGSALSGGANAVANVASMAAPFIPGGQVVSAAVTGLGGAVAGLTASGGGASATGLGAGQLAGVGAGGGGPGGSIEGRAAAGGSQEQMFMATKELQEMNQRDRKSVV